jgi:hypothetical protein
MRLERPGIERGSAAPFHPTNQLVDKKDWMTICEVTLKKRETSFG